MKSRILASAIVAWGLGAGVLLAETIQLPYQVGDGNGNQWMVYYQGNLQMQGNQPIFSQAGMITVNGQQPRQNNQQAQIDDKTREIVLDFRNTGTIKHQRRFKFDEETGVVRIIDVFENSSDKESVLNLQLMSNVNFGINAAQMIEDGKKKAQLGWAADTGGGRAAMCLWAGKGSKLTPSIRYNQGNNVVNANLALKVPGKDKAAIVQWHGSFDSADAAVTWAQQLRESKQIADVPEDIKKVLANVGSTGYGMIAGRELLRGDSADVVELRGGDRMRGTLKIPSYKLNTAYGLVQLPADRVASLLNVGDFRVRQLVITHDGEIFGGELAEQSIPIELSSGQTTQVPLSQLARLGYRTNGAEPTEWQFKKPMLFLRSGERCAIAEPQQPITLVTRYGQLNLKSENVSVICLKTAGAQEVYLSDGSKLTGIISTPQWQLTLTSASGESKVPFPLAAISRVQIKPFPEEAGAGLPTLSLVGGDIVATRLTGQIKLVTTFDTLDLNAAEIRSIVKPDEGLPDVQVTLFDQSTFRGSLETPSLKAKLVGDLMLEVPIAALREYDNPQPFPSQAIVDRAKEAITQLNAEEWKAREAAELTLVNLGPSIVGVLDEAVGAQPPESQQRLQSVIKKLRKDTPASASRLQGPPPLE